MNTTQSWESVTRYISLSFPWVTLWHLLMNFVSVFSLETRRYLISNITSKLLLTKTLRHINKTELFFFQKNANYLRKNQMWSYALGIYFSWTYTPRRVSVHSLLSFFLTLREDIFWTQTTAFLLFWLLTYLISMHKMLFLFIREQQEAGCGIPTVRLCAWGQVPTAQPQWETQTIWIDCWAPLSQYLGLCLHFWDQP